MKKFDKFMEKLDKFMKNWICNNLKRKFILKLRRVERVNNKYKFLKS